MTRLGSLQSVGRPWSLEDQDQEREAGEIHQLLVTTVHDPPYMNVIRRPEGSYSFSGYIYDIWKIMAKKLNIRFRMVPLISGDYGTLHPNGTWSGMVGELAYGRADVAVTTLDMKSDRASVIDYLDVYPLGSATYKFYVRKEEEEVLQVTKNPFGTLIKPLHVNVWWTLLASVIVLSTILWISWRLDIAQSRYRLSKRNMTWPLSILLCFMLMIGQGWSTTPSFLSARIVTMFCCVLGIITTTSYTANLISHLAVIETTPSISSLKEFSKQSDWKLAVSLGHSAINDWKVSNDLYERGLYRRTITGSGFVPLDISSRENARKSISGKVMAYVSTNALFSALHDEACGFVPVPYAPERSSDVFMAIARGRKRLRRDINRLLHKMGSTGVISGLKKRWVTHEENHCQEASSGYRPLALGDVFALLLIVPLAVCLCIIVFCLEWLFFKQDAFNLLVLKARNCYRAQKYKAHK